MAKVVINDVLEYNIADVWNKVTSLTEYIWRSDIEKIEVIDDQSFVEYTKSGYATTFKITNFIPMEQYEFDMINDNMVGHWVGKFYQDGDKTIIEFTEEVTVKKFIMKLFVKKFLKKQQKNYIEDLKKTLRKCGS